MYINHQKKSKRVLCICSKKLGIDRDDSINSFALNERMILWMTIAFDEKKIAFTVLDNINTTIGNRDDLMKTLDEICT